MGREHTNLTDSLNPAFSWFEKHEGEFAVDEPNKENWPWYALVNEITLVVFRQVKTMMPDLHSKVLASVI